MSATYTAKDYNAAERAAEEAGKRLADKVEEQAAERDAAVATIERLDKELEPLELACDKTRATLLDLRKRRLGPWRDDTDGDSSSILTFDGSDLCWDNRVWLRVARRDDRAPALQWEVCIQGPEGGVVDNIVLGPVNGSRKEDLEARKREVEAILVKKGFIVFDSVAK